MAQWKVVVTPATDRALGVLMGGLVWRVLGTGSAVLAGIVANKLVTAVWKKAGQDDRIDPRNPDVPVGQALAFAAAMGLAIGAARTLATRKAAQYYRHSAGHLPKVMQEGDA